MSLESTLSPPSQTSREELAHRNIVIFGATSAIVHGAAKHFAAKGCSFWLIGRSLTKLEVIKGDLLARGARLVQLDVGTSAEFMNDHEGAFLGKSLELLGDIDIALFGYGSLPDQSECERSAAKALECIHTNFSSLVVQIGHVANYFESKKRGSIVAISSVAGDRGRQSNYMYGCAKGALSIFLQGLRNRLWESKVQVLDVKPGFVISAMTKDLKQGALFASADAVGEGIYRAVLARKNVVYLPWFWRYIMAIIRGVPEELFKRLKL